MISSRRSHCVAAFTTTMASMAMLSAADAAEESVGLEEVVVTARRASEGLHSVPVQVNVLTAEALDHANANDLAKISENIPFVTVTPLSSGSGGGYIIRGIGNTGTDVGLQQTVLLNLDNVFVGRARIVNAGMFDIGQVEVLKGPQALFFGKNSPAGVISISSRDPTQHFEAYTRLAYEFNAVQRTFEGAVSGPVTETFRARLAGTYSSMKGYIKNNSTGYASNPLAVLPGAGYLAAFPVPSASSAYGPNTDTGGARLTLVWEPDASFNAKFKYTYSLMDSDGSADNATSEITCRPGITNPHTFGIPQLQNDCLANQENAIADFPAGLTVNMLGANGGKAYSELTTHLPMLELNYVADKYSVTSVTGYYKLTYKAGSDSYHGDAGNNWVHQREKSSGMSEELRLTTSFESPLNGVVGVYVDSTKQGNDSYSYILNLGLDPVTGRYYTYHRDIDQTSKTYSALGQLRWSIRDNLELDAGARYTSQRIKDDNGNEYVHSLAASFLRPQGDYLKHEETFTNWSPEVTLTYKPQTDQMVYAAYKTGYKSGGFSAPPVLSRIYTVDNTAFQPEKTTGFELGYKSRLLGNTLSLELTGYYYDISSQQVSVFEPSALGFLVGNAGKSRQRGMEASLEYRPINALTINSAIGYNDTFYVSYPGGACYAAQTSALGCVGGKQDLSGRTLPRAPKWAGNLGATYEHPIGAGLLVKFGGSSFYTGAQNTSDTLDPFTHTDSYWRFNAFVTLSTEDERYELSVIGRNITDAYEAVYSQDLARGNPGEYINFYNRPREVSLQGTLRF